MPDENVLDYKSRMRTYQDVLVQFGADSSLVPESIRNSKVFLMVTSCLTSIGVFDRVDHIVSIFREDSNGEEAKQINAALELLESKTGIPRLQVLADTLRHGTSAPDTSEAFLAPIQSTDTIMIDSSSSINKSSSSSNADRIHMLDEIL